MKPRSREDGVFSGQSQGKAQSHSKGPVMTGKVTPKAVYV